MSDLLMGHIAHEHHGFLRVPCRAVDGIAMLDDDIRLGPVEHMRRVEALAREAGIDHHARVPLAELPPEMGRALGLTTDPDRPQPARASAVAAPAAFETASLEESLPAVPPYALVAKRWCCRTVHWTFFSTSFGSKVTVKVTEPEQKLIKAGIDYWRSTGIFQFIQGTSDEGYLVFRMDDHKLSQSSVGRMKEDATGRQTVWINREDAAGTVAHEIGHALGLFHEHKRRDAASYLGFDWTAIAKVQDRLAQYISQVDALRVGYYDYGSIMHYSRKGRHAKPSDPQLIWPLDPNAEIHQRDHLAMSDLNAATAIYAEGVSKIEVQLTSGAQGTDGEVFLGLGGREFRLAGGAGALPPNEPKTITLQNPPNDPSNPPLSVAYVLGLPSYLRLAGATGPWSLKSARVTVTVREVHDVEKCKRKHGGTFLELPPIVLALPQAAGPTLGPGSGRRVYLRRTPPDGVATDTTSKFVPHGLSQRSVGPVRCKLSVGGSAHGSLVLGLGGREFALSSPTAVLAGADLGGVTEGDLQEFPAYLYARGASDCRLTGGSIEVTVGEQGQQQAQPIELAPALAPIALLASCGAVCQLKYKKAPRHHTDPVSEGSKLAPSVHQIQVTLDEATTGKPDGNTDALYLGLGGREFRLALEPGRSQPFVLGKNANVRDAAANDPSARSAAEGARLSLLDVDTHPTYLRKEGAESWTLTSVDVTVFFDGPCRDLFYWGSGSDGELASRYRVFSSDGGRNPPMTVQLTGVNQEIAQGTGVPQHAHMPLGGDAGTYCALVRKPPPAVHSLG